ncbi:MAG: endonuclease III [Candidatus Omnitrophota bacterium]
MGNLKSKAAAIIKILREKYPGAKIALNYKNPLQLLVATVLSAQCTDKRVNIITQKLFDKYRNIDDYARAKVEFFEQDIRSAGFFRNKAKNIISAAQMIKNKFKNKVPNTMEDLTQLPGVARKTANIILFNGFGKQEGIAVDTHVRRLSQRLGLTEHEQPEKIECDLMRLVPRNIWGIFSDLLIEHGRAICMARNPLCPRCVINKVCNFYIKNRP